MSKALLEYIKQLEEFILVECSHTQIETDKYPLLKPLQSKRAVVVPAILRPKKKLD